MVSCVLRGSGDQKEFHRRRIGLWKGPAGRCLTCSAGERSEFHWILQPEIHMFTSFSDQKAPVSVLFLRHLGGGRDSLPLFPKKKTVPFWMMISSFTADKPETGKPKPTY